MLRLHQNVNNHHNVDAEERHYKFKTARKMLNTFWTPNIYIENTCINRWEFCLRWSVNCGRLSSVYNFKCLNDFFSTLIMGNQIFFTVFVCHHVSTVKLRIVFYAVEI